MTTVAVIAVLLFPVAVARLTRLVNADEITDPIRIFAMKKWGVESRPAYFLQCPWCVSFWLSIIGAPLVLWPLDLPMILAPLLALAASHLTGLASQLDRSDADLIIEDDEDL